MRSIARFVTCFITALSLSAPSVAASLRVAPVILDLSAPTSASTIRIWNDAQRPINVQVRVFRWTQQNGNDVYETASDVAASPPITTLQPGGENIVRIVRTTKQPVQAEESYRLVVDELPSPSRQHAGTVTLVVRHSIPVFFAEPDVKDAHPSWSVEKRQNGYMVSVRNDGDRRFKVSNLSLISDGTVVAQHEGLVGYVLGSSTASWFVPEKGRSDISEGAVTITADSETGRFDATARISGG
ncbi:molecular chaperone [Halomonas binhaiensis]|uniref:Molecular chaperone n=1 Tax=Halomonas binhaiensis TaxID=2562282 RepID=A0A5C1NHJ6_9GAMM|nr:molecular chaperone [Halomonas binhaiensis]QEM81169.1 molecular chaperone [Halomonas binhaiensis]